MDEIREYLSEKYEEVIYLNNEDFENISEGNNIYLANLIDKLIPYTKDNYILDLIVDGLLAYVSENNIYHHIKERIYLEVCDLDSSTFKEFTIENIKELAVLYKFRLKIK